MQIKRSQLVLQEMQRFGQEGRNSGSVKREDVKTNEKARHNHFFFYRLAVALVSLCTPYIALLFESYYLPL